MHQLVKSGKWPLNWSVLQDLCVAPGSDIFELVTFMQLLSRFTTWTKMGLYQMVSSFMY